MKKESAYLWLSVLTFVIGFWVSFPVHWIAQWRWDTRELDQYRRSAAKIEQEVYGENHFHTRGIDPASDALLAAFDPATSQGFIVLKVGSSYWGGESSLKLFGNGQLYEEMDGKRKLVTTVEDSRCKAFFLMVLTSGILNFSPEVIELKKEVLQAGTGGTQWRGSDVPDIEILVSVPELNAEGKGLLIGGLCEEKNFPRMIEFRALTQIQQEMLALVPAGYSLGKRSEKHAEK